MTRASSAQLGSNQKTGLLLAVLLALVAGILVFVAINSRGGGDGEGTTPPPASGELVQVVRATQNIPARTEITAAMVEVVFIPVEGRLSGAFTEASLVVGRVTTVPVIAGEQIIPAKAFTVTELAANSLSYVVPEGYRAVAVSVDRIVSPAGLLRPGDRVDVIVTLEITYEVIESSRSITEHRALTIAQNVEVLAIDEALQIPATDDGGLPVDQPGANTGATVATLALTPHEAQVVFFAENRGTIRLTVRAPGDDEIVEIDNSTVLTLVDPEFAELMLAALRALAGQGN